MSASITVNQLGFTWPDGTPVLDGLDVTIGRGRTGLIGNNGAGKSTLVRLVAGDLTPTAGSITVTDEPAWLAQHLPLDRGTGVDELLGIRRIRTALRAIESGDVDPVHFTAIGDDWDVEERAYALLGRLGLSHVDLDRTVGTLSGGESMLVGLAGRLLTEPRILIMDEPTNNLDIIARQRLYRMVDEFTGTLLVVSHDRELLSRMDTIAELRDNTIRTFEGNLADYEAAIAVEQEAAERMVRAARSDMNKQKQELIETQVKLARRERYGRKMSEQKREPKIVMGARKRAAQVSAAKLRNDKQDDLAAARARLDEAVEKVRDDAEIHVDLPDTAVPAGRDVMVASGVDVAGLFGPDGVNLHIRGPERIGLLGANGSGKTTLLRLLAGELTSATGTVRSGVPVRYLPQRLELLDEDTGVFDNVKRLAPNASDTLIRTRLARFLFRGARADQPVSTLSGGEKLRAALAAVLSAEPAPQLLMLDEPTNNLDMLGTRRLRQALTAYRGALVVVSHDPAFLRDIGITRWLRVERGVAVAEVDGP